MTLAAFLAVLFTVEISSAAQWQQVEMVCSMVKRKRLVRDLLGVNIDCKRNPAPISAIPTGTRKRDTK